MCWRWGRGYNAPARPQLIQVVLKMLLIVQAHQVCTAQPSLGGPGNVRRPEQLSVYGIQFELCAGNSQAGHRQASLHKKPQGRPAEHALCAQRKRQACEHLCSIHHICAWCKKLSKHPSYDWQLFVKRMHCGETPCRRGLQHDTKTLPCCYCRATTPLLQFLGRL